MIDRIANNKFNTEEPSLNLTSDIVENLNYYRSLFGKVHDFRDEDFEDLKNDIIYFFNLKPGTYTDNPPKRIVRISNNNKILQAQGKPISYLTEISQILAPPVESCGYGRCNIPSQQVLYCGTSEASAYWETKPKNGDVITLSHFELKPNEKINCNIIKKEKKVNPQIANQLQEVFYLLDAFFVDAFTQEIERTRPRDYLFSAILSSEMMFYKIASDINVQAIIYPSVQKKKFGENFAIRNDLILEKYNLIGVETRFILDEYEFLDPTSDEVTTDQVIGSFATDTFDFQRGKILYNEKKVDEIFDLFRMMQLGPNKQIRYEHPGVPRNLTFNMSRRIKHISEPSIVNLGRNDRVNVIYKNGKRVNNTKYKNVEDDVIKGNCIII